ncbi:LacI family DNA-binding transcriptional regulator [Pseudomonas grimontii]|jgi:LacI family transcriptional regulator|uniref:LacI family DNA-binding transcriptional regulator n=1 Tax=Pseudomonas grimontii TaxID=129847 RepID=UPI00216A555E|nr:LacI family DNA-binding transcriptional regulator [Pseudomonas grimontii]MCS3511184.1 LacI family transcriptional regulator [Pseudomonas grimontii]
MATIKDVAALAGISYTTVSHVVNKTRPVSEPVRIKVEAAIKQLDYVPSAVARSLKAKTTATIGLLVPNSLNPYFAELARGIEDCCERNGYCVILCNSDDNAEKQRSYLRVLLEKRVDGLIVTSVGGDDSGLAAGLSAVRTPMVIVDRALDGIDVDLVRIDHEEGAYLATRHLLELGHRDIACIGGPAHTRVAQMRLAGYHRALHEAGVRVIANRIRESDFTSTGGYAAAVQLLAQNPPSAIFASNDMIGFGVLRAAAERNIRVPGELSVIGFDDIQMSRYVYPALTTVGQSILQLGETAAELLLRRIATPQLPIDQRIVTPSIVLRESTAPVAGVFAQYR